MYVVRKWPLRAEKSFWVLEYHTSKSVVSVHFLQNTRRACLRDLADLKARNIASVKNIDAHMLTACVCGKNLNIVSMCAVSPVVHISNICSCHKKNNFFRFPEAVNNSIKGRSFGFLVINVCNYGEHYETPCINVCNHGEHYETPCINV